MTEDLQPDISEPVDAVYAVIREWFPHSTEDCEELAFAIVHDVLHLKRVGGELWSASIDSSESPHQH